MGSIPTRSRHFSPAVLLGVMALVAAAFGLPQRLAAQDTTRVSPGVVVIGQKPEKGRPKADSAGRVYPQPPVSPMGAFFRSLLIPGWSQAKLGRRLTGGLFLMVEGLSIGMTLKTTQELNYLEQHGDTLQVKDKKSQQQDWLAVLVFNHLFAGLEGYVGAHLWDFPADVKIRAMPTPGGKAVGVIVPFRLP